MTHNDKTKNNNNMCFYIFRNNDFYLSLDNLSNMDRSDLADFNALNENFTNMKKDEVLLFLKSWIAENAE